MFAYREHTYITQGSTRSRSQNHQDHTLAIYFKQAENRRKEIRVLNGIVVPTFML